MEYDNARDRIYRREVGEGRYIIKEKIGSGSFGEVYLGVSQDSGREVAIKLENVNSKHPQLRYEMKILKELQGGVGIAELLWYGVEEEYFSVLVTTLLGKSLEDLFNHCKRRFSPTCVMLIGEQLLDRIEFMHDRNFIHRDIKPDNFLIGRGEERNLVYVIDFGLSKKYFYPNKDRHIPFREGKNLTGTPRYASINNHHGYEQSRRDDMESIGYVLVYFARGKLPWQGLKATNKKEKYTRIMSKKERVPLEELCAGLPSELYDFLKYSRSLRFEERPDYRYLRGLFQSAIESGKYGDPAHAVFDWIPGANNPFLSSSRTRPMPGIHSPRAPYVDTHQGGQMGNGENGSSVRLINSDGQRLRNEDTRESVQRTPRNSVLRDGDEDDERPARYERRRNPAGHDFRVARAPAALSRPKVDDLDEF